MPPLTKDSRIANQAPPVSGSEIVTNQRGWPVVVRVVWDTLDEAGQPTERILRATAQARDMDRTAYQCWVFEPSTCLQWIVWLGRDDVWQADDPAAPRPVR